MSEKIKTAEDFLNEDIDWTAFYYRFPETTSCIEDAMINYAKYHVEKALKAADRNKVLTVSSGEGPLDKPIKQVTISFEKILKCTFPDNTWKIASVDSESILEAYPLSNIE